MSDLFLFDLFLFICFVCVYLIWFCVLFSLPIFYLPIFFFFFLFFETENSKCWLKWIIRTLFIFLDCVIMNQAFILLLNTLNMVISFWFIHVFFHSFLHVFIHSCFSFFIQSSFLFYSFIFPFSFIYFSFLTNTGDLFDLLVFNKDKIKDDWLSKAKISLQIAQACFYLHSKNIIHRDLKVCCFYFYFNFMLFYFNWNFIFILFLFLFLFNLI